jgi:predicted nucleotidyltransferase component of viral defense system
MALNTITHKNILVRILKDIFTDVSIGPILGFKGGTAVFLFHQLNRFSVDIDLDLLDLEKADFVFDKLKQILANYGSIKQADSKRHSLLFILSYENKTPGDQNLKVEINLRNFDSKYEVLSFLGISMKVMTKEDMFAHKLCAMHERMERANRDIFDVHYFLSKKLGTQ